MEPYTQQALMLVFCCILASSELLIKVHASSGCKRSISHQKQIKQNMFGYRYRCVTSKASDRSEDGESPGLTLFSRPGRPGRPGRHSHEVGIKSGPDIVKTTCFLKAYNIIIQFYHKVYRNGH